MRFAFGAPVLTLVAVVVATFSPLAGCSGSDSSPTAPIDSGAADSGPAVDATDSAISDTFVDETPDANDGGFSDKLSMTSLYDDFATKKIAASALSFVPTYELWADGTGKHRWMQLPAGTKIDTSDMDNWVFPIGTKFWKEFDDKDTKAPLETRLIERTGDTTYRMGAYIWAADGSDATYSEAGAVDVNGTEHDVPDLGKCQACHNAAPGKINGFQAIQLSHPDSPNLTSLAAAGLLSNPPAVGVMFPVPGNAVESAALGYLHANCGHCHNPRWELFTLTNQQLRLNIADKTVADTTTVRTTVFQHTTSFTTVPFRIYPGDSTQSALPIRMGHRGDAEQMPALGTKVVDATGVAAVKGWIDAMPKSDPPDAGPDSGPDASGD